MNLSAHFVSRRESRGGRKGCTMPPAPAGSEPESRFARALLDLGAISVEQLAECSAQAEALRAAGLELRHVLLARGVITPEQAARALDAADDHPVSLADVAPEPPSWLAAANQTKDRPDVPPEYDPVAELDGDGVFIAWHVRNRHTGRSACLKIADPDQTAASPYGIRREAEILRRLEGCPVVPRVFNAGVFQGRSFVETELVDGEALTALTHPVGVVTAASVGARVARALGELHRRGIVWRHLKPKNIRNYSGEPCFLDFGFAVALDECEAGKLPGADGAICGTPRYMAPETITDGPITTAVDWYAFGCVLYELLAGRAPFTGSVLEILSQLPTQTPDDPRVHNPNVPEPLARLVLALLAKRPEDRPTEAAAIVSALESVGNAADTATSILEVERGAGALPEPQPFDMVEEPLPGASVDWVAGDSDIFSDPDESEDEVFGSQQSRVPTVPNHPGPTPRDDGPSDVSVPPPPIPVGTPASSIHIEASSSFSFLAPGAEVDPEPQPFNINLVQDVLDIQTHQVFDDLPPVAPPPDPSGDSIGPSFGSVLLRADQVVPPPRAPDETRDPNAPALPEGVRREIRQGTQIGPYKIVTRLGEGAFGSVYLAEDTQSMLGTRVALKIPKSQSLTREELDRYRHEAKLWRALSEDHHPNVLELFNLNRFDEVIAFVMEFVDGPNLADFAAETRKQGAFGLGEAIRVVRCVAEALRAIHSKRVYHGDLKPANVLVRREDRAVKVTDFSISRSVGPGGRLPTRMVAGSPPYMAPEVWEGKPSLQSDIFALGVMFYELVTGERPFAGDGEELGATIRAGRLSKLPSERRADLPFEVERIILRCLEVSVEDRYASVPELLEDLRASDTSQDLVAGLAECILGHSAPADLEFLLQKDLPSRGYRGGDRKAQIIEYCLDEDPTHILMSCFSKAGLSRLADHLGAGVEEGADREPYAQAILSRLGLAAGGSPRGIRDSVLTVTNLRHRLEQCRDAAEVTGLVSPAAREYEKVLRDLLRFYGQFLYGRFYERSLVRLARRRVAEHKRDLSRATLGDLVGILQVINEHVAGEAAEAQQFRRVFRRTYAVPPEYLAQSRVVSVRNEFLHWNDRLARASLAKLRDVARDMLTEILVFLEALERDGIYPRVIVVDRFVTDRFGRKYIYCRNDQGHVEKVFTNVTIDPSRHYFFYPTTNPMRIYPILLPA
jgi:serine/threonine protein kinase